MRRVDRHRRQDGEQAVEEFRLQPFPFGLGDAVGVDDLDARDRQFLAQLAPAPLLFIHQGAGGDIDPFQRFGRRQAVSRDHPDPLTHLPLQPGDAGHEEFVQVIGRDRQESQPLQQRMGGIGRFLQDPGVEFQPGNLAIEEPLLRDHQAFGQVHLRGPGRRDLLAAGRIRDGRDISHGPVLTRGCGGCKGSASSRADAGPQFGRSAPRGPAQISRTVRRSSRRTPAPDGPGPGSPGGVRRPVCRRPTPRPPPTGRYAAPDNRSIRRPG